MHSAPADSARLRFCPGALCPFGVLGAFCPAASQCAPATIRTSARCLVIAIAFLRHHHRVARLQTNVLLRILALDHIFVVEGDSLFASIGARPQNVDRLLFGKVLEPPAIAIASSTVVDPVSRYAPGRDTIPRILIFRLLLSCTITLTSGSEM